MHHIALDVEHDEQFIGCWRQLNDVQHLQRPREQILVP